MNILMMTNTYLPHVGGVARSVQTFAEALRHRNHRVLIVAPTFQGQPDHEHHVIRVPAIQRFNGSDFSVRLPIPGYLSNTIDRFSPDLVHAHHPFLLGDTALTAASYRSLPLVFTHHTLYERYTHYVPGDSPAMSRFAVRLATTYANLCDHVIAPSQSIADLLHQRGVTTPITPIPTGIDPDGFACGDGAAARKRHGLPAESFVVGHVGRLAPEKNLTFLARAVARFLADRPDARFLVVGSGPAQRDLEQITADHGVRDRLHLTGPLTGADLANAYHALDAFAFASTSETQGMVLAEAMTVGVPVVALDAPGAREVVQDGRNGFLLTEEDEHAFAEALSRLAALDDDGYRAMADAARRTADRFTVDRCTDRLLGVYQGLAETGPRRHRPLTDNAWTRTLTLLETEWNLWKARASAAADTLLSPQVSPGSPSTRRP